MKLTIKYVMQSKNENEVILGMPKKQQLFSWEEEENLHSRSCSVFSHGLDGFEWEQFYVLGSRKVRVHREKLFRGQNIEGKIVSGQYRKQKTDGTDISWGSISLPLLFYPCFCSSCAFMCFYLQDHM